MYTSAAIIAFLFAFAFTMASVNSFSSTFTRCEGYDTKELLREILLDWFFEINNLVLGCTTLVAVVCAATGATGNETMVAIFISLMFGMMGYYVIEVLG